MESLGTKGPIRMPDGTFFLEQSHDKKRARQAFAMVDMMIFEFYEQGTQAFCFDGGFLLSNVMVAGLVSGALLLLHGSLSKGSD